MSAIDDDVAEDGAAFLVMELLHGESVEGACDAAGGRLSFDVITAIALQALDVFAAAHQNGIVHRDIKPANLFLTVDGELKVLDFGIARLREGAVSQTRSGMSMGTPAFMAPEQALARTSDIDARTDLWAIGATMFTLASGQLVHQAENAQQVMIRAATSAAPALGPLVADAPPEVVGIVAVIDRALATRKEDRWPSASAMKDALLAAAEQAFPSLPGPELLKSLVAAHGVRGSFRPAASASGITEAAGNPTGSPVEVSTPVPARDEPTIVRRTPLGRRALFGGAALAVLAVVGAVVVLRSRGDVHAVVQPSEVAATRAISSASQPEPTASAPQPSGAVGSTSSSSQPSVPLVGSALPVASATQAVRPARPPAPSRAAKLACDPPFEFVNGKKRFKEECL